VSWFENEFLDAPVQNFGDIEFVFGGAGDFVNPPELAELLAGFAEYSENFSVEGEFVDAAGETVGAVEDLVGRGRDANGPGSAGAMVPVVALACCRWRGGRWDRRERQW